MLPESPFRKRLGQDGSNPANGETVFLSPHTAAALTNNNNIHLDNGNFSNFSKMSNAGNHSGISFNIGGRDISGRLTPQNSFTGSPEHHMTMMSGPSLLAPPSKYAIERRPSSSSLDSHASQVSMSRRRSRRGSMSRLSDFEEERHDVTLMTYARALQLAYAKIGRCCRKFVNSVFMAAPKRPKLVCEGEVMEQTSWICRDYIIGKLTQRELLSRKVGIAAANWPQSHPVVQAGEVLENLYPKTFSNVSRKLCMTMSSTKIVRNTLSLVLEVLFEGSTTWGKIVSMFAIAGLYAEECVSQGHPEFVEEVVDVIADFTGNHLLCWLVAQGGWNSFPLPEGGDNSRLSKWKLMLVGSSASVVLVGGWWFLE